MDIVRVTGFIGNDQESPESLEVKRLKKKLRKLEKKLEKNKHKKEKRSSRERLPSAGSSDGLSHSSHSRNRELFDKETLKKQLRAHKRLTRELQKESDNERSSRKRHRSSRSSESSFSNLSRDRRSSYKESEIKTYKKELRGKAPSCSISIASGSISDDDRSPYTRRSKVREPSVNRRKDSFYKTPIRHKSESIVTLSDDDDSPHTRRSKNREPSAIRRSSYKIPKREFFSSQDSLSDDDLSPHKRRSKDLSDMRRKESYKTPQRDRNVSRQSLSKDDESPQKRRPSPGYREPSARRRPDDHESSARRRSSPYRASRPWYDHDIREGPSKAGYYRDVGSRPYDRESKYKTTDKQLDSSPRSNVYRIKTEVPSPNKNTNLQNKLLSQFSSKYKWLHEDEVRLQKVVDELMNHVDLDQLPNFRCLEDSDKNIVYDILRRHVVIRLTNMKIANNLDTVNIVLDYKLKYETLIDKSLFNAVTTELISLGPENVQSMNSDELSEVIEGVLKNVQIDKILEDTKPDINEIKQEIKTEDTEDYEDADCRRIDINIQLVPMATRPSEAPIDVEKIKQVAQDLKKAKPKKFYLTIRRILKEMTKTIYDTNLPSNILIEKLIQVLEHMIANLLIGRKKMRADKVRETFRKAYPKEEDGELVRTVGEWYMDGAFENKEVLEKLLIIKQESHKIEDGELSEDEDIINNGSLIIKQERADIKQEPIKTESQDEIREPIRVKQELPDISEEMDKLQDIINTVNKENSEPISVKQEIPDKSEEMETIDDVIGTVNSEDAKLLRVKHESLDEEMDTPDHIKNTISKENSEPISLKQEIPDISEEMDTIDDVIKAVNSENAESVSVKQEIPDISGEMDKLEDIMSTVNKENDELISVKQLPDIDEEEMDKIDDVINTCEANNTDEVISKREMIQEPMDTEDTVIMVHSAENSQDVIIILDSSENSPNPIEQIPFLGDESKKSPENVSLIPQFDSPNNENTDDKVLENNLSTIENNLSTIENNLSKIANNGSPIASQTQDNVSHDIVQTVSLNVETLPKVPYTESIDEIKSFLIKQLTE